VKFLSHALYADLAVFEVAMQSGEVGGVIEKVRKPLMNTDEHG
jgi:hypothetical protein